MTFGQDFSLMLSYPFYSCHGKLYIHALMVWVNYHIFFLLLCYHIVSYHSLLYLTCIRSHHSSTSILIISSASINVATVRAHPDYNNI